MSPSVLPAFFAPLLAHLYQATLFGLLIAALLLAFPSMSARLSYGVAWAGLAKFLLPLALLGLAIPTGPSQLLSGAWLPALRVTDNAAPVPPHWFSGDVIWRAGALIWLSGVIFFAAIAMVRAVRFARQLRADRQRFDPDEEQQLVALAATIGINPTRVTGWLTSAQTTPGVSGIFRSRIHVPRELLHSLSPDETEAVLLHELAHVARRDNLWRLLQTAIVCVCWFHPLVWWLHRRLILESERACDEAVVRRTRDGETYAQGLFKAARFSMGLDVPGFSGMARSGLSARLATILKPIKEKDHPMLRLTIMLIALVGFVFTTGASAPSAEESIMTLPVDYAPRPVEQVRPTYPPELRGAKIEGEARIAIVIDSDGVVRNPEVVFATRPEFGQAALEAVIQWKFLPGIKGGRKVNTRLVVPIVFSINPGEK